MDEIIKMIQTLGFPIAVAIALFWQNNKLQEQHKQEMQSMTAALNNNTIALTKIEEKMGGVTK